MLETTRRRVVQALGLGGAASLAGCTMGDDSPGTTASPTATNQVRTTVDRIAADPTDVPDPVDWDEPRRHEVELTVTEETAEIEPGVTFDFMTFDGRVPGPMIRVRRGDTVALTLTSPDDNAMPHNVDFHAVYGPGGGAEDTTIAPGESATIEFKLLYPGVHIYHCAVPNLDQHISAGMFGAILVEPEDGLPPVDRELFFGQHEIYTDGDAGEEGHHGFDFEAMRNEEPTYVVYNGEAYAFTGNGYGPVEVEKGERVRIFMANGGPNLTSSWHAIGNVWADFYRDGALANDPEQYVETAPVAPGTVACAEIDTPVPGPVKLVDHAITRVARKGTMGVLQVNGSPEPTIFDPDP
ncbi:copper-containing nitrite reductase [Haloarchaeobius sp. HRN-SO-5]|uniref:copper-containing nitrite reductase n=1 Tax=Haloarchaeobius sp. HRN-SO-5 TaxID=3446118 RepID=UPI003EB75D2C